ncbi:MAG: GGDEF domain-containing protein [Candidatus Marinimicrobia bacterium]|nr:GGDEF domain-containing protein [Candidatus Neomarinimicrobiota bacterium]
MSKEVFAQEQAKSVLEGFQDKLTGLFNRDFFDQVAILLVALAQRQKEPLTLLYLDLDDFKKINDQYGHPQGDRVLEKVGAVIKQSLRASDLAARYGGEEVVILLPRTKPEAAKKVAQRLLKNLANHTFKISGSLQEKKGQSLKLTASLGLAEYQPGMNPCELIGQADQALLQAKKTGKNKIVVYG